MRISIALATYNGERWLREQLDSLASQTLLPCELVVSDDQSTDRAVEVVEEFATTAPFPVRIIRDGVRRGFADNFINALRYCKGDAVAYCDQDDVWNASKLERCAAAMRSDPSVTLVHHDTEEVGTDLRSLGIIVRPIGNPMRTFWAQRCSIVNVSAMGCCMFVHRRVVDAVLSYWPEPRLRQVTENGKRPSLSHDITTMHLARILGTVIYVSDPLIRHRRHHQNTWSVHLPTSTSPVSLDFAGRAKSLQEFAQLRASTASTYVCMAERAEAKGDGLVACYLARVARRDSDSARFLAGRAELYRASSRLSRLAQFVKMLRGGIYSGLGGALIGIRSAIKDLAFAVAGPRAPQLLEMVRDMLHLNFHPQESLN